MHLCEEDDRLWTIDHGKNEPDRHPKIYRL